MLRPTPETLRMMMVQDVLGVLYVAALGTSILYLIWCAFMDIRDWHRRRMAKKYMEQTEPVEWILDYPGYAVGEYYDSEITEEDNREKWGV